MKNKQIARKITVEITLHDDAEPITEETIHDVLHDYIYGRFRWVMPKMYEVKRVNNE